MTTIPDPIDTRPSRRSGAVAIAWSLVVALITGLVAWMALAIGIVGATMVAIGVSRGSRRAVAVGIVASLVAVIVAGAAGGSTGIVLLGGLGAVLALDAGVYAIDLGQQLGRDAQTASLEAYHLASSATVGIGVLTVGYAIYVLSPGGYPVLALVLLIVAAGLVVIAIEQRDATGSG